MKILTVILTLLIFTCCKTENKKTIRNIKSKNQINSKSINLGKQIMVSSGQMSSSQEIIINGCRFDAVIKDNNDTIYLTTHETKFITPENVKVGMKFSQIPFNLRQNIQQENGWGYYIELESKWCIGFCEGISCTDKSINSDSEVKWIFKRK